MNKAQRLFEIADSQEGFFTARQAREAGYQKNHVQFLKNGKWERARRGIYRLAHYPLSPRSDLMVWLLWSCGRNDEPQGVLSHETALTIYELSDVMPARIHMTVPKKFRHTPPFPKILKICRRDLPPQDIGKRDGLRVTTPLRTLEDIIVNDPISEEFMWQAVRDALDRGLIISKRHLAQRIHPEHVDHLSDELKRYLNEPD